jgi:lysophospholipase L1-like esterase
MERSLVYFVSLIIGMMFSSFKQEKEVRYLPLGDSYTICTGAPKSAAWPLLLTGHLKEEKINVVLLDNPARNGFSTQNLIDLELPLVKKLKPDFVTLLIGVNDWVREVPAKTFIKNYHFILDEMQKQLSDKKKIVLITIPDFGVTPTGKNYGGGRNISKGIAEFNEVIKEAGKERGLRVVDIFEISKQMKDDESLVATDGLHPSAKEYAVWEKMILPEVIKLLKGAGGK